MTINKYKNIRLCMGKTSSFLNKLKGDFGEYFISNELLNRNFSCYKNMSEDSVDLVCLYYGRIIRIQVKTISGNSNSFSFPIGDVKYRKNIDYFALIGLDDSGSLKCQSYWFVPRVKIEKIIDKTNRVTLSLSKSSRRRMKEFNKFKDRISI